MRMQVFVAFKKCSFSHFTGKTPRMADIGIMSIEIARTV